MPDPERFLLTVTPNPAVDRVIFIDEFRPGGSMRASAVVHSVGGKALDAAVVLETLGAANLALSFMAGAVGHELAGLLDAYGVRQDTVWTDGETRVAHVIVETAHHRHSHVTTGGLAISAAQQAEFLRRYADHLSRATWAITGGSLPPDLPLDFYGLLAGRAAQAGVPLLVDAAGPAVPAMLRCHRPAILKLNRHELADTFGLASADLATLAREAEALRQREGLEALVLTCGGEGILALTAGAAYLAVSPAQVEVNAAGAGDAVSAALPYRLACGDSWSEALRWAAATSAAVVLTPGTADCRPADIAAILPQTTVQRLA